MIKISLILPAFNTAEYLEKCVDSCEKQDIAQDNFEVIIVNDGSTDNTGDVARSLQHKYSNIRVLNQNNQGLSQARNNGVDIAKGEYIWFIDSDDFIAHDCLGKIYITMTSMKLDMLGVGPSIPFTSNPPDFQSTGNLTSVMTGSEWTLHGLGFIGAWAYVFSRHFWNANGFSFMSGIYFEDMEFIPKACLKANRICSLAAFSCYSYVRRQGSIMNSPMSEKKINDLGKIVDSYSAFINDITPNQNSQIIQHFKKLRSSAYLTGIVNIVKIKDYPMLIKWLNTVHNPEKTLYGRNIIENIFQYIVMNHPRIYFNLRKVF